MGAFLRREAAAPSSSEPLDSSILGGGSSSSASSSADSGSAQPTSADALHEIGTFAQVHTIVPGESGAMMLLVGHRRLRRMRTVRFHLPGT